jgi:hypothetical protein
VDDITAVVIILLEGNPKDKSWGAAQKMMNNVDKFLERLRGYKGIIDQGQVRSSRSARLCKARGCSWLALSLPCFGWLLQVCLLTFTPAVNFSIIGWCELGPVCCLLLPVTDRAKDSGGLPQLS